MPEPKYTKDQLNLLNFDVSGSLCIQLADTAFSGHPCLHWFQGQSTIIFFLIKKKKKM